MAGKVFFSVSMSLDGFIAPESSEDLMGQQWMELQAWVFPLRFFRENLKLGEGGEEGLDNDIARATFERTGASVMGKRMFDAGEQMWPEEAPFHTPVFVVTHEKRDPWERPAGTTFQFVNDGIEPALDQARAAPGAVFKNGKLIERIPRGSTPASGTPALSGTGRPSSGHPVVSGAQRSSS